MPTVVIIHAAEDTLPARALAEKLRQAKLTVVLEKPPGDELRDAVKGAPVTIALWSPRSVTQQPLIEEVNFARGKSKVFHACMQSAAIPEQFRNDKSVNLTGWRGEDEFAAWRELAKLVTDKAGVAPLPPPAPKPPSGFFQPGRPDAGGAQQQPARGAQQGARPAQQPQSRQAPPPRQQQQQQAPRPAPQRPAPAASASGDAPKKGGGMMIVAILTFIVVAAAGGGGYWWWSQQQGGASAATAWEQVDQNDASSLRAFISADPGEYRDEAEAALVALEQSSFQAAMSANSIEALEAFVNDFPESEHAIAAQGRIAELRTLAPATTTSGATAPTEATDPDLVPPGSTTTTPAPDAGGPAALSPPAEEPAPEPDSAPTN
ncbi:MAG: TIR domain-containing protein [Hyphomonadaceae bacterium]